MLLSLSWLPKEKSDYSSLHTKLSLHPRAAVLNTTQLKTHYHSLNCRETEAQERAVPCTRSQSFQVAEADWTLGPALGLLASRVSGPPRDSQSKRPDSCLPRTYSQGEKRASENSHLHWSTYLRSNLVLWENMDLEGSLQVGLLGEPWGDRQGGAFTALCSEALCRPPPSNGSGNVLLLSVLQ